MIFSHVLYQLSYPGSAAAAVLASGDAGPASGWKRAYGEAGRAWQEVIRRGFTRQAAVPAQRGRRAENSRHRAI
jgi:hypothetical protein